MPGLEHVEGFRAVGRELHFVSESREAEAENFTIEVEILRREDPYGDRRRAVHGAVLHFQRTATSSAAP